MSKPELNIEVAAKYSCNLTNPTFSAFGKSYALKDITLGQVDELVAKGIKCFTLIEKTAETPKEANKKSSK